MRKLKFYVSKLAGHRAWLICLLSVIAVYSLLNIYGHAPAPVFTIYYHCAEAFHNYAPKESSSTRIKEFTGMPENSIFFLEVNNVLTNFSGRLLCAFESAARYNRDRHVYVILSKHSRIVDVPDFVAANMSNVHFVKADFSKLLRGSPVSDLWDDGDLQRRRFCVVLASDLIRLVLASRYGGTYMDTDVICVRAAPTDLPNFVVAERNDSVVNAVFSLTKGHVFAQRALESIASNFLPDEWGHQGPILFTKLAKELCAEKSPEGPIHTHECCCNLTILPPEVAFATPPENWTDLFDYSKMQLIEDRLARGKSFAVHYWNHIRQFHTILSWNYQLRMETRQPMYKLFERHCPMTEEKVLRGRLGKQYEDV